MADDLEVEKHKVDSNLFKFNAPGISGTPHNYTMKKKQRPVFPGRHIYQEKEENNLKEKARLYRRGEGG